MISETLSELAAGLSGSVIGPEDEAYDEARTVWNGTVSKRPAVIVKPRGAADVVAAVNYARREGLAVSVRGGGHHVAGAALVEGGLVIDLSEMRAVRYDPSARTAHAQGGALLADLDRETLPFGVAVPTGLFSETGVAGLTLAGGYGWLRRQHGLACDNLVSADVVTAGGELIKASASENPDLFWALRGGGWDMGVVTSFEYRTHPIAENVFFTFVTYPVAEAEQVLAGFDRYMQTAPLQTSPILVYWSFPPAEPYPEEVWNKDFVGIAGSYNGSPEEGQAAMQPLRELGTPLFDASGVMPFAMVQRLFDEEYPTGRRYYWKSSYLREMSPEAIATLIKAGENRPSSLTSVDVWPMGGAIADVGAADSAIGQRHATYLIGVESNWEGEDVDDANIAWARNAADDLAPYSTGGTYLNFDDLSDTKAVQASHGVNFDRLVEVKRRYDPDNLFRSRRGLVD
jgi:FAD/FMN-containing dehydrogenase